MTPRRSGQRSVAPRRSLVSRSDVSLIRGDSWFRATHEAPGNRCRSSNRADLFVSQAKLFQAAERGGSSRGPRSVRVGIGRAFCMQAPPRFTHCATADGNNWRSGIFYPAISQYLSTDQGKIGTDLGTREVRRQSHFSNVTSPTSISYQRFSQECLQSGDSGGRSRN